MANLAEMIKTLDLTGLDVVPVEGEVRDLVQSRLLEMLDDVSALCREQGIPWMMGGGSALGAVRHHGFIPWDDDIDINMSRAAFERFLPLPRASAWTSSSSRTRRTALSCGSCTASGAWGCAIWSAARGSGGTGKSCGACAAAARSSCG